MSLQKLHEDTEKLYRFADLKLREGTTSSEIHARVAMMSADGLASALQSMNALGQKMMAIEAERTAREDNLLKEIRVLKEQNRLLMAEFRAFEERNNTQGADAL